MSRRHSSSKAALPAARHPQACQWPGGPGTTCCPQDTLSPEPLQRPQSPSPLRWAGCGAPPPHPGGLARPPTSGAHPLIGEHRSSRDAALRRRRRRPLSEGRFTRHDDLGYPTAGQMANEYKTSTVGIAQKLLIITSHLVYWVPYTRKVLASQQESSTVKFILSDSGA